MSIESVVVSGVASGAAAEHKQNRRSAPLESTIGSLDTRLKATADPDTQPAKTLPETSIPRTPQSSQGASRDETLPLFDKENSSRCVGSGREAVQRRMLSDGVTPNRHSYPIAGSSTPYGQEYRGAPNATSFRNEHMDDMRTPRKMDDTDLPSTSTSRGRGKGQSRSRGLGRSLGGAEGRRSSRKTKVKREKEGDDDASDFSEEFIPTATTTKSGRSVQKPTSYVPPPTQAPVNKGKRKRTYRANPETAVCRVCLRGTSPDGNMIVFCDGCNTPYHRYCHHPPIDQAVVDEVDMEWYCRQCERQRAIPVPESEVADFTGAEGSSIEQRLKYFSRLKPGVMVTLLARATTLQPELPLFDPKFAARHGGARALEKAASKATENAASGPLQISQSTKRSRSSQQMVDMTNDAQSDDGAEDDDSEADNEGYSPSFHPPNYPKPGQGLMKTLPPDKDDVELIVDDDDTSGAFTHIYRDDEAGT